MKTFKHRITGKIGIYPEHFVSDPNFIPYDPKECIDCGVEKPEEELGDPNEDAVPVEQELESYLEKGDTQW